jgi:hypothetical protein
MTRNGAIGILTASLAFTCVAAPARAQRISDERIHELIKQAADRVARGEVGDARQTTTTAQGQRPVVSLTLDDAVRFALERNLDIAVQRVNP